MTTTKEFVAPDVGVPGNSALKQQMLEQEQPKPQPAESELPKKLSETLEALNTKITSESSSAKLLADPQIRAYLEARARGENPQLVSSAPIQPKVEEIKIPELPKELDNLTNSDIIRLMNEQMSARVQIEAQKLLQTEMSKFRKDFEPLINSVHSVQNQVKQTQVEKVNQEIVDAMAEFKDFNDIRPKMVELANSGVVGLSIKELYALAKIRAGQPIIPQSAVASERPSQQPSERVKSTRSGVTPRGRGGFEHLVAQALENKNMGVDTSGIE